MTLVRTRNCNVPTHWNAVDALEKEVNAILGGKQPQPAEWTPPVDVIEAEDKYILEVDLPGLTQEDIDLTVEDNVVTLKGERKRQETPEATGFQRFERRQGSFARAFRLSDGVEADKVTATFTNGVLHVELPKPESAKPRKINVKFK